jgi:two-component system response regulator TctD
LSKRTKIFLVDDEIDVLLTIKTGLEDYGFVVDAYDDPINALSNFKVDMYGLTLLDVRLPKMNGLELSLRIRKLDNAIKVCFITAFPVYYEALLEENPNMDFSCFIKKPVSIESLAMKLRAELQIE